MRGERSLSPGSKCLIPQLQLWAGADGIWGDRDEDDATLYRLADACGKVSVDTIRNRLSELQARDLVLSITPKRLNREGRQQFVFRVKPFRDGDLFLRLDLRIQAIPHSEVSDGTKLVRGFLDSWSRFFPNETRPSQKRIADALGYSVRSVNDLLARAEKKLDISRVRKRRKPSVYSVRPVELAKAEWPSRYDIMSNALPEPAAEISAHHRAEHSACQDGKIVHIDDGRNSHSSKSTTLQKSTDKRERTEEGSDGDLDSLASNHIKRDSQPVGLSDVIHDQLLQEIRKCQPIKEVIRELSDHTPNDKDLIEILESAPDWSIEQIMRCFVLSAQASRTRPGSVRWFKTVLVNDVAEKKAFVSGSPCYAPVGSLESSMFDRMSSAFAADPMIAEDDLTTKRSSQPPVEDFKKQWFEDLFWPKYPRKVGKKNTLAKFVQLATDVDAVARIMLGLWVQASELSRSEREDRGNMCPYPEKWLDGERFLDENSLAAVTEDSRSRYLLWISEKAALIKKKALSSEAALVPRSEYLVPVCFNYEKAFNEFYGAYPAEGLEGCYYDDDLAPEREAFTLLLHGLAGEDTQKQCEFLGSEKRYEPSQIAKAQANFALLIELLEDLRIESELLEACPSPIDFLSDPNVLRSKPRTRDEILVQCGLMAEPDDDDNGIGSDELGEDCGDEVRLPIRPREQCFGADKIRQNIDRLVTLIERNRLSHDGSVQAVLKTLGWMASAADVFAGDLETLERELCCLEAHLIRVAQSIWTPEELRGIKETVWKELSDYESTMNAEQKRILRNRTLDTALLDRAGLPRLSMFSWPASASSFERAA